MRQKNLYLYFALSCCVAVITIFVHGYMGIYDTTYVTARGWERTYDWHWWGSGWIVYVGANWGETVHFRYEIENRRFSYYLTSVQASVWKKNEKVIDLFSEDKSIGPFDKAMVGWILDSEQLQTQGFSAGRYTVRIERKGVMRVIGVNFEVVPPIPLPPLFY